MAVVSPVKPASASLYWMKARSETTTSRKMIVRPESRIVSAISLGVFCRFAPSTSAIIRSRKVLPGSDVMRMTIRSLSTRVPPVTALRSPPLSRITGADSPVMADLIHAGDALDDLAIAGNLIASLAHHQIALLQLGRRDSFLLCQSASRRGPSSGCAFYAGRRPAPCRALLPSPRRSWRTAR